MRWYCRTQDERDAIMDYFWREYFRKYPEKGVIPELNAMRIDYEAVSKINNWKPQL